MKLLLCVFLLISLFQENDVVEWSHDRKLKFEDFKLDSSAVDTFGAGSCIQLVPKHKVYSDSMHYTVHNYFYKDSSWMKVHDTLLLKHEQGHFDINEVVARRFRKYFSNVNIDDEKNIGIAEEKIYPQLLTLDSIYDAETNHGVDLEIQQKWNVKIQRMLDSLKDYENPEGTVIFKK